MWSIATLYPSMILLHGNFMKQTKYDKIFMDIWGFPKMVVPNNHGFSYWKWSFGGVLGVPPFKETPWNTHIYFTKPFLPNGQHPWRTSARRMPDYTKHVRQRLLEQIRKCNDSHPPKVLVASHDMLGCNVLLMEEIRLTNWYGKYPIIYRVSYMSGGAGFCASTVSLGLSPQNSIVTTRITIVQGRITMITWYHRNGSLENRLKRDFGKGYVIVPRIIIFLASEIPT